MSTVRAESLDAGYPGREVLSDVTVTARPGRVSSIIGPNGAGKTTLVKCLAGLLDPTAGQVTVGDRPLGDLARRERAAAIAYVPQAEATRFPMSVFDTVLLGRRPYLGWVPTTEDLDRVAGAIDRVGIAGLAERAMHQLSGGERQLVGIAKAIAQGTGVLLLDEPTTYLDLEHQLRVSGLMTDLAADGTTVITTIHDLNFALGVSDDIVVLHAGGVVATGPPAIVDATLIADVYGVSCEVIDHDGVPVVITQRHGRGTPLPGPLV